MKFSRADSRVRRFIKSDVSETDSVNIIMAVITIMMDTESSKRRILYIS